MPVATGGAHSAAVALRERDREFAIALRAVLAAHQADEFVAGLAVGFLAAVVRLAAVTNRHEGEGVTHQPARPERSSGPGKLPPMLLLAPRYPLVRRSPSPRVSSRGLLGPVFER